MIISDKTEAIELLEQSVTSVIDKAVQDEFWQAGSILDFLDEAFDKFGAFLGGMEVLKVVDKFLKDSLEQIEILASQGSMMETVLGDSTLWDKVAARFETVYHARQDFVNNYGEMR